MASPSAYCWECNLLESDSNRVVTFWAFSTLEGDHILLFDVFQSHVWCSIERSNIECPVDPTRKSLNWLDDPFISVLQYRSRAPSITNNMPYGLP